MTNEEALELLKDTNLILRCSFTGDIRIVEAIDMAIKALGKDTNVPATWIPVSERLPEEGHDVLITKESFKIKGYEQHVIKAKRSVDPRSGKIEWWSEFGTLKDKEVLAWMPLPEPAEIEG